MEVFSFVDRTRSGREEAARRGRAKRPLDGCLAADGAVPIRRRHFPPCDIRRGDGTIGKPEERILEGQILKGQILEGQILKGQILEGQILEGRPARQPQAPMAAAS
jgi:hypothetical protein